MTTWSRDDLARIGAADEVGIAPRDEDGTLHRYTTIWVVRVGDELYVRSWRGRGGRWFRHARQGRVGRLRAADMERDVSFQEPDDRVHTAIDDAYRSKYGKYGDAYVAPMTGPDATAATFRLLPR